MVKKWLRRKKFQWFIILLLMFHFLYRRMPGTHSGGHVGPSSFQSMLLFIKMMTSQSIITQYEGQKMEKHSKTPILHSLNLGPLWVTPQSKVDIRRIAMCVGLLESTWLPGVLHWSKELVLLLPKRRQEFFKASYHHQYKEDKVKFWVG